MVELLAGDPVPAYLNAEEIAEIAHAIVAEPEPVKRPARRRKAKR